MAARPSMSWLVPVAAVVLVAALVLLPGLGDHGLWTEAEIPALDRVRAALGASLSDLEHNPWLPETLRTRSYGLIESPLGLRLPHALAVLALAAMAAGVARMRGATAGQAALAGGFALAFPMAMTAGRATLGNPIGEAVGVGTVLAGLAALRAASLSRALPFAALAAGLLALSVSASGLALGAAIPLGALAAAASLGPRRRGSTMVAVGLWAGVLAVVAATVMLSLGQEDGYIPVLGAAKDLVLVDKPENVRFAAGLEDLGYGLFPWAPLVVVGALLGRDDRLPALWLGLAVAVASGWTLVYGPQTLPVTVPAALCALSAVRWVLDPRTDRVARRTALAVVVLGMLVIGKDATASPSRVAVPVVHFDLESAFPDEEVDAVERLGRIGSAALWALLAAGLLAPPGGRPHRVDRLLERLPAPRRDALALALVGGATVLGAFSYARLLPDVCDQLSPKRLLERHAALAEAEALPAQLGNHRVRDAGLRQYGPGDVVMLASRRELTSYLSAPEPRVALIRDRDLPAVHQDSRQKGWPFFLLDERHMHLRLVANVLPEGVEDQNRIPTVVFDELPALTNPTRLQFENYIEVLGWEVTEPVVRGREATVSLAIRVLRPLPGGSKVYARLQKDRTSRINADPHELTDGLYPPNLWRDGDFILHRFTFKAPALEIQPGEHKLIVGLRRSEKQNFEISVPEGKKGEFGVHVRGKKRNFATIGRVQVW